MLENLGEIAGVVEDSTSARDEKRSKSSVDPKTVNLGENLRLHELKRVQSVKEKIKSYQRQKLAIKEALCNLDRRPKNKIIFDDNYAIQNELVHEVELKENKNKRDLFHGDDEEEEEDTYNLEFRKEFDGEQGKQLLELQSRFQGDQRFKLNERFLDNYDDNPEGIAKANQQSSMDEEKKTEIDILEQVLGTKVKPHTSGTKKQCVQEKKMLRYDPTHSEHTQYEVVAPKKQTNTILQDRRQKNESEQVQEPVVSKDIFYKVSNDLKTTFEEQEKFSLLNLFGKIETNENKDDSNPVGYEPSDDEKLAEPVHCQNVPAEVSTFRFTSEALFFKEDDFRQQEASDFSQRISSEKNADFQQKRQNLKCTVKAKVRNNTKRNNPFKKRLGGNKRKKILRIKKALQK